MKPILFNTEMVKAIMDGRKNVTRRVVKPQPVGRVNHYTGYQVDEWRDDRDIGEGQFKGFAMKPPCQPGDILYVRETWQFIPCIDCNHDVNGLCHDTPVTYENADSISDGCFVYRADYPAPKRIAWKPSIHMPKNAARIFLRVVEVRVERLRDITGGQLPHEGIDTLQPILRAFGEFAKLWDKTIKPDELPLYGWNANPWVWVIGFERCGKEDETV